jgi:predicted metalloprotease with PDZ domain
MGLIKACINRTSSSGFLAALLCTASVATGSAAGMQMEIGPAAIALQEAVPTPRDRPFAGCITLEVDATDTARGIFSVHETIPVQSPGDMVLLYPEWEIGSHAPTASAVGLAGLVILIDGRRVEWRRDPVNIHAFHVLAPAGSRVVDFNFQFLSPTTSGWLRPEMVAVPWHRLLLYPAGWFVRDLTFKPSLRLPASMQAFTSLDCVGSGDVLRFALVSLERLVDSPVYASGASREVDLTSSESQPVRLDLLADDPADLAISVEETDRLRALVRQTERVFGQAPFRHYDMLVSLSDRLSPGGGIEHLEEGENNLPARYFVEQSGQLNNRDLIAHEFVHAWNGRFRQPADLWTPTFNQPSSGSLLWVYEGQTEFWGRILAARAGLRSIQETLDKLALDAATAANRPGREWKSLADSTNDAIYMAGRPVGWRDWQRREDYYSEGVLLWLDVEARLRELSGQSLGLDDFARGFFHAKRSDGVISTYTFEDICRALDGLAHGDWAGFLLRHLQTHAHDIATEGLARSGWRLVYKSIPSETFRQDELERGGSDQSYSIGAVVEDDGRIASVVWQGALFRAGISPGARVVAINGKPFSPTELRQAVASTVTESLRLEVATGHRRQSVSIDYRGGSRYPWLERIVERRDLLTPLLSAR